MYIINIFLWITSQDGHLHADRATQPGSRHRWHRWHHGFCWTMEEILKTHLWIHWRIHFDNALALSIPLGYPMPSPIFGHWFHMFSSTIFSVNHDVIHHQIFFRGGLSWTIHLWIWGTDPSKQGHVPAPRAKADEVGAAPRCDHWKKTRRMMIIQPYFQTKPVMGWVSF